MADPVCPQRPVACVLGASGDIGVRLLEPLITAGYLVVAAHRQMNERLASLAAQHDMATLRAMTLDVRWPEEQWAAPLHATFTPLGDRCDLLVIAHGHAPVIHPVSSLASAVFAEVLATDVVGAYTACRLLYPLLCRAPRASVVLLSSMHALACYPERVPYATAKAAVCGMARALAVEWAQAGIQVNALAPGQVYGARTAAIAAQTARNATDVLRLMHERSPSGRLVDCADLAETVLWLARTPGVTGQTIVLDAGVTVSNWYKPFAAKEPCDG